MKKELLAPAGDIEAAYAAFYYGADAVYLGLKQFSARATANNFTEEELGELTAFAHHLGKKVFVTINTVLQTSELEDLMKVLEVCKREKVDAVILQDLGVARIVKKMFPELEMHASTQMVVHNKQGALALKNLGFSRVVLARELTLAEIKEIATIENLELEAFVHGALCYSYSGVCQFSSFEHGRSANRGKCLYPCRAKFEKDGKEEHCFSMKDMALDDDVLKMPVYSLKIEGRKKNALYVAAVTDYYRNILDGNGALREKAQNIKQIFSRPWCKFHFKGKNKEVTDKKFVGHRGLFIGKIASVNGKQISFITNYKIAKHDGIQIDVEGNEKPYGFSLQNMRVDGKNVWQAMEGCKVEVWMPNRVEGLKKGAAVYLASSSDVKGSYGYSKPRPGEFANKFGIEVEVEIFADKVVAKIDDTFSEIKGVFEVAKNEAKTIEAIKTAFGKTGDTKFELVNIKIYNEKSLFVPISVLNELRRKLYEKFEPDYQYKVLDIVETRDMPKVSKWVVKIDDVKKAELLDWNKIDEVILLIDKNFSVEQIGVLPKNKVRIALPAIARNIKDFEPLISKLLDMGYKKWEIANYWGLSVLPLKKIDLSFDNLIYMFNVQASQMAKEMKADRITLPVEDNLQNIKNMAMEAALKTTLVVYQDVPLFTSAVCIRDNSCKDCDGKVKWIYLEKDGKKYEALSKDCQLMMFDKKPFCIAEEAKEVRADFYRADFLYKNYSASEVAEIFEKLFRFEDVGASVKGNIARRNEAF